MRQVKYVEKLAIAVIVLWALTLVPNYLLRVIIPPLLGSEAYGEFSYVENGLLMARSLLAVLVHIGVAVWLFILAGREGAVRWIWALFALVFGLSAPMLYLLMQIDGRLTQQRSSQAEFQPSPGADGGSGAGLMPAKRGGHEKRLEKLAVIAVVLWLASLILEPVLMIAAMRMSSHATAAALSMIDVMPISVKNLVAVAVHIAVSIWLFRQAKRDGNRPWIWALFGLVFSVTAVVLYLLSEIILQLREARPVNTTVESSPDGGDAVRAG